jgi:hypothetical protein
VARVSSSKRTFSTSSRSKASKRLAPSRSASVSKASKPWTSAEVRGLIRAEQEGAAVGQRRERGRLLGIRVIAVGAQVEIVDDGRMQQAAHVRRGRDGPARPNGFADGRSSDDLAALDCEHAAARPREVRSGHEAVMTGADHDRIVALRAR